MLRSARLLVLLALAAGCSGAKSGQEEARLADRLSEAVNERKRLEFRVAELERQLAEARRTGQPAPPAPERPRPSSRLRNAERNLVKARTELDRARTTIKLLEERIAVKDAMLTGSKVEIDKAVQAQIDAMYRRSLSSEKAAEVAEKTILQLRAQLAGVQEELARAREMIARLRGTPAGDNTDTERPRDD